MRTARTLDEAQTEYLATLRHYLELHRELAVAFREEFRAQLERARARPMAFPAAHARLDPSVRRFRLDRFPYAAVFAILDTELVVLAVHHQRRKPGYWKPRLAKIRR